MREAQTRYVMAAGLGVSQTGWMCGGGCFGAGCVCVGECLGGWVSVWAGVSEDGCVSVDG